VASLEKGVTAGVLRSSSWGSGRIPKAFPLEAMLFRNELGQ
jgi:hypothetical protein